MQCHSCERLFSESLLPLMLSCGHTTCNLCVAKIEEQNFPCPSCARPFHCSSLNLTFSLQNSGNEEAFCEICEDQSHPATFKCIDCNQFLCDLMVQSHKKVKATRLHNLVPISKRQRVDSDSVLSRLQPKRCSTHDHPFTHYNELIHGSHLLCVYCAAETANKGSPSILLSSASLSKQKVEQAREYSPKISDRINSLNSVSETIDKIKSLNESRDLALGQIQNTFQTYRQALDAREEELKGRVEELHKSAKFEIEEEAERAQLYVGQLEQYAKGLEEMEAALTLVKNSNSPSLPEGVLVDVCLLEASLRNSFSHSMDVCLLKEGVEFKVSSEGEGGEKCLSRLGRVSYSYTLTGKTLLSASEKGELEVVRALLDRGDDVNQKDSEGCRTPLYLACRSGHLDVVSLLLDHEATVNKIHEDDFPPVYGASCHGYLEVVRFLIKKGANIHEKIQTGWTSLHAASQDGHLPVVSHLLDEGANINEKTKDGWTALLVANLNGHLPVVSHLLNKGASINEKNNDGWTSLHVASYHGHLPVVSLLLDKGANIHEKNNNGLTSLNVASFHGHLPVVSHLLDKGANINEKNNNGYTPLHFASQNGHLPIVSHLLERGANIHEKTKNGNFPLSIASKNGHLPIVSLLLDRGANINEKTKTGKSALYWAIDQKRSEVEALLRARGATE